MQSPQTTSAIRESTHLVILAVPKCPAMLSHCQRAACGSVALVQKQFGEAAMGGRAFILLTVVNLNSVFLLMPG